MKYFINKQQKSSQWVRKKSEKEESSLNIEDNSEILPKTPKDKAQIKTRKGKIQGMQIIDNLLCIKYVLPKGRTEMIKNQSWQK